MTVHPIPAAVTRRPGPGPGPGLRPRRQHHPGAVTQRSIESYDVDNSVVAR